MLVFTSSLRRLLSGSLVSSEVIRNVAVTFGRGEGVSVELARMHRPSEELGKTHKGGPLDPTSQPLKAP